jgi:RNA polymerase sigma-70 factor (ECF subfamily)
VAFFARRLSPDEAEDLAQVTLVRIAHALPWIEADRADDFIATVARNRLRTAYRRWARDTQRRAPASLAETVESPITAADLHAEWEELARIVARVAAARLPPALNDVVLGVLRGETPTEIAERLHLNPVTVRTRLLRARVMLRDELRPLYGPSDLTDEHRAG